MERIAGSEFFPLLASYVFPGEDVAAVGRMVGSIGTSEDNPPLLQRAAYSRQSGHMDAGDPVRI